MLYLCIFLLFHDFHLSRSKIYFNPKTKRLEIIIRVFSDDLNMALKKPAQEKENNQRIQNYLDSTFILYHAEEKLHLKFLGFKIDQDAKKLFLKSDSLFEFKPLSIQNRLFFELFDDQSNIINIDIQGKQKSYISRAKHDRFPLKSPD